MATKTEEAVVQKCSVKKCSQKLPEACNFIKKRLWHRCFPVSFMRFHETPLVAASTTAMDTDIVNINQVTLFNKVEYPYVVPIEDLKHMHTYSRVPNNRPPPPRLLIFRFFSTQDIFISTSPFINFQSFLLTFLSVNSHFDHSPS